LFASFFYVGLMPLYSWQMWPSMVDMKPEEFATYLSDVFAPFGYQRMPLRWC